MLEVVAKSSHALPNLPSKRYFTIGEVSELCAVKPHVLRYWEQEFPQLKPVKRRGNRRYYQKQDVMMIHQIRTLLYEEGFTIGGARQKLAHADVRNGELLPPVLVTSSRQETVRELRSELEELLSLLKS